jgi:hypothetical protein
VCGVFLATRDFHITIKEDKNALYYLTFPSERLLNPVNFDKMC